MSQETGICPLGDLHGFASTYHDKRSGELCCDFCGQPVRDDEPTFGDAFDVGVRSGLRHMAIVAGLMAVVAAILMLAGQW